MERKRKHYAAFRILVGAGLVTACTVEEGASQPAAQAPATGTIVADIRADSNRDGDVRFDESDGEKTRWDGTAGAIFLANIDDDQERCKKKGDDLSIAACNDAADDVVNGPDDALDLARIKTRPWPEAPEGTTARIEIATEAAQELVRLFKKTGPGPEDFEVLALEDGLSREDVQAGIELGIEAKDIVRDASSWDGYVDVRFVVTTPEGEASDTVRLRVSPVMTFHHLLKAEKVWISDTGSPGNADTRKDLSKICDPTLIDDVDPWTQDFFETGYTSMPGPGGAQHVMHVSYRSANVYEPGEKKNPLRPAGQVVFTTMRGKDSAGVQQFDVRHESRMDSLNSFGNFETVPPYGEFPLGRVLRGRTKTFYPDRAFTKMIDAQSIQLPAIDIDTSWLVVGHVDETLSFIQAKSPRGWVLLANDARLAKKMLEEQVAKGNGSVPMFVGKNWIDWDTEKEIPAQITIADVLADTEVMKASADAAVEVDGQVAAIVAETGLTDAEIVRVPFLHMTYGGLSIAYQPGMVNGLYLGDGRFLAPDPHGPVIEGKDIFQEAMKNALAPYGVTVTFIEDWEYHVSMGEVHCGTNATRAIPDKKWWETGR